MYLVRFGRRRDFPLILTVAGKRRAVQVSPRRLGRGGCVEAVPEEVRAGMGPSRFALIDLVRTRGGTFETDTLSNEEQPSGRAEDRPTSG